MSKGASYYPIDEESAPLNQGTQYYGTFPGSVPPGFPQPVHPSQVQSVQGPVTGYPVVDGTPVLEEVDRSHARLPCCGIGIGWFLFILGWFLASVPWYIGVVYLICIRHDRRERVGLVCCTIAAILSLLAAIIGGTRS